MKSASRTPLIAAIGCVVLLSGCFMRRGGGSVLISSFSSDYSPVVSFNAKVRVTDSVRVHVDHVRILSPGEVLVGMGAVTGKIEMQALAVVVNPAVLAKVASSDRNGTRKPWIERTASTPITISDSLTMGVAQTAGPMVFTLPVPPGIALSTSWLVFRISGPAVAMPARNADGSMAPGFAMPGIRVFACALKNLDGKTDTARDAQMKEAYSAGC